MQLIKSETTNDNKNIEFVVAADPEEFREAVKHVYLEEKKNIQIPGFRKGKVPQAMIENMYGKDVFDQGALEYLVEEAFSSGLDAEDFEFIGQPALKDMEVTPERGAQFTFLLEKYPDVELGQYKGLEIPDVKVEVSEEDVDKALDEQRRQNARTVSVDDRKSRMGDTLNIDFEGFLDKEKTAPFEGGKGDNYDLKLGSHSFVEGFEEQLVDMEAGEEKDIAVTFPKDYYENLAGKDVVFHVKVNDIKYDELPELDDEFAKDVSEFDTLEEYRNSLREELLKKAEIQRKSTLRYNALRKAIRNMKTEVPETIVRSSVESIIRSMAANYGLYDPQISLETLVSMLGIDEGTMKAYIRPAAIEDAKKNLLVRAIIKAEELKVSQEKLDAYVEKLAERTQSTAEEILKQVDLETISENLLDEEVVDLIADSAVPVEGLVDEEEEKPETDEVPAQENKAEE